MRALTQYRESHGLTQAAFADLIGVTQPTVSELERGKYFPSVPLLKRISEVTGLSVDQLLSGETHAA